MTDVLDKVTATPEALALLAEIVAGYTDFSPGLGVLVSAGMDW